MSVSPSTAKSDTGILRKAPSDSASPHTALNGIWLSGGIVVVDDKDKIISANDSFSNWLGITNGELKGEELPVLIGDHFPEWKTPMQEFLNRHLAFDRMELAAGNDRSL